VTRMEKIDKFFKKSCQAKKDKIPTSKLNFKVQNVYIKTLWET
jgi:hypothetical protein